MRDWNLKAGDPLTLVLAADARYGNVDYCNDHIWELSIGEGEPPSLALQTTYGLRAISQRIFPRFIEKDLAQSDPAAFSDPITIHRFYPNYIRLSFAPFSGINVLAEYWVPNSNAIASRYKISNQRSKACALDLEWAVLLNPFSEGQRMAHQEIGMVTVLTGSSEKLAPVFFLTGGALPGSGSYPSLVLSLELTPGESRYSTWIQVALNDQNQSFELARQIAASKWDAEVARIELTNSGQVEIYSGKPDWDAAFAMAQKTAMSLILPSNGKSAAASYVSSRHPDHGYSRRGDGSDYNHLWNGQTPLETYYLVNLLLPSDPGLAVGLLENYLETQNEAGEIDWKPGLGGQRGQLLSTPILTSLAWQIYQSTEDPAFLERVFPKLLRFVQAWFSPAHDRDSDGVPEWDHALQIGYDDHPVFSPWHIWSSGVDTTTIEGPDLCSFLYKECNTLIAMAKLLGKDEALPELTSHIERLKEATDGSWDDEHSAYHYWDRDTHFSIPYEELGKRQGAGLIQINREYLQSVRLQVRITSSDESTRVTQVFIHGTGPSGGHRVERIPNERFRWYHGIGRATTERTYTSLEHIEFQGLHEEDQVSIHTVCHTWQDQANLLPLWAGIPENDRASTLIKRTISNQNIFWSKAGLRFCPESVEIGGEQRAFQQVDLPWNLLIAQGLLAYGHRTKASLLMTNLMYAIVQTLKQEHAFTRLYKADTGRGIGERHSLSGLAPVGLFLDILGVRIISPRKIILSGSSPFSSPVTVKYRGLTIVRQSKKTMVIFPDGQNITTRDNRPQVITLD